MVNYFEMHIIFYELFDDCALKVLCTEAYDNKIRISYQFLRKYVIASISHNVIFNLSSI